jgi:cell division transport system permease protein
MSEVETTAPGAIIPPEAAPLKALTVTMTVMCYLACLAIGALILINRAVDTWTTGLSREVTVQIRMLQNEDIEHQLAAAAQVLKQTPGIQGAEILDRSAGAKLLEPWIGSKGLDELPIPRLIRVTVADGASPDFVALEQSLKEQVKGASLDTHRRWAAELTRMASALSTLSLAILALICISAVAMVIFATRTVLDANRQIVDVLHLIGAKDRYIARQINKRFVASGLLAGLFGVSLGILTFLLLGFSGTMGNGGVADASRGLLFSAPQEALRSYGAFLSVPALATMISLMTSRLALIRMLGKAM